MWNASRISLSIYSAVEHLPTKSGKQHHKIEEVSQFSYIGHSRPSLPDFAFAFWDGPFAHSPNTLSDGSGLPGIAG